MIKQLFEFDEYLTRLINSPPLELPPNSSYHAFTISDAKDEERLRVLTFVRDVYRRTMKEMEVTIK